jgi:EamA domain-containing membrane protein RarD
MRAYVITTGIVFALIVVAHVARAVAEGLTLLKEPDYILSTLAAVALVLWSWRVFRTIPRP